MNEDHTRQRKHLEACVVAAIDSQSRATLDSLASFAGPRARPRRTERNFGEQTIANGNRPSP